MEKTIKTIKIIAFQFVAVLVLLLLFELAIRLGNKTIVLQYTSADIFQDDKFSTTPGLKPNVSGISFGKPISTDAQGYLEMGCTANNERSVVLIGDSVTQGVGVETSESFAGLLSCNFQDSLRIINTALVGYTTADYINVAKHEIGHREGLSKVLLFYCLNDLDFRGRVLEEGNGQKGVVTKILAWLRTHSYAYIWLKGKVADRPKSYFEHDSQLYAQQDLVNRAINDLIFVNQKCKDKGIGFSVILLPYEYQLRNTSEENLLPQALLKDQLAAQQIAYHDAFETLSQSEFPSKDLYLYGDGIHFSKLGHKILFEYIVRCLP